MTYFVKVSSVEGNPELKSVDVVVDGVVRPAKYDADDNSKFVIKIPDTTSRVDIIATPQTSLVQYVHINGSYDSKDEATGAVTLSNVVVNSKETTATIEVKAKDGTTKRYTLVITKVAVNTDLMNVTVNGTTVSNANGTYTYLKTGISSDKTADVSITTQDANSTVKVEAITRDLTKSPYGLSYNEVGSESQNVWANDAVTLHSQPVNRYRITVTGQDGFTTKEYTLIIRDTDTNADVEYIKVGTYYAVKESSDVNVKHGLLKSLIQLSLQM